MNDIAQRIASLSPEQRALLEQRMRSASPRPPVSAPSSAPIAIIGMACRLPGRVNDLDAFWRMLRGGVDGITTVPPERWDADRLFDQDPAAAGKLASRWGGFIGGVDEFDAGYFGISPREAMEMDPQQRILLETAIDALDNAGMTNASLAGTAMGVFVGVHGHSSDYMLLQNENLDELDTFSGTGAAHNLLAGRLSYFLDTHGPAVVVDTACSSSLVALHLALQSVRAGESSSALVAGVNLILTPNFSIAASRMRMLAPDGRCKAFDQAADGFVRSEGCGVVVLRRLSDAVRDGDPILAVVRGSAINQDGHTNGITAPNGLAQRQVIDSALANAGVSSASIGFVEAHGTGTSLGDPIEVEALAATVGQSVADAPPCFVGSVKTNIGHLEGAAGIAGLMKAVLVLQHGEVPPNLHFAKINPYIKTEGTRLRFPVKVEPWPRGDAPRRAAVSSFGWSGTNAHVILEEAPAPAAVRVQDNAEHEVRVLPISGFDTKAAAAIARKLADRLRSQPPLKVDDVCFTAAVRRNHHDCRMAVVGRSSDDLARAIDNALREGAVARAATDKPRIGFIFPGHGAQWAGMGQMLLQREPVFQDAIARCDAAIAAEAGWSLIEQIAGPPTTARFAEAEIAQPAVFAFGVALAELWASWGVVPDAVVGHSMGEVAAAYVAGALSLTDATRIICRRSRLLQQAAARGGMLLTELSEPEARREIAAFEGRLSIGAVNGPRSTVLAGDHDAIEMIATALTAREMFCRVVPGSPPGHSHLVSGFGAALTADIAHIAPRAGGVPFYSTVTANRLRGEDLLPSYWASNLCQPVRFHDAILSLLRDGINTLIEVGPHPILTPAVSDILAEAPRDDGSDQSVDVVVLPSLHRNEDDHEVLYGTVARLYERGSDIRWPALAPRLGQAIALPPYVWQRKRYWLTRTLARRETMTPAAAPAEAGPDVSEWLYTAEWTEAPEGARNVARPAGRFIIVAGRTDSSVTFSTALEAKLTAAGDHAMVISGHDQAAELDRASNGASEWSGIIHCAGLDATPTDAISPASLTAEPVPGRESLLAIVRSLDTGAWKGKPRLWVVTRGATVVSADDRAGLAVAQAPLSGLARVIHVEHPALFSAWIDVDAHAALGDQAANVVAALSSDGEPALAFRGGQRYVERLLPLAGSPAPPVVTFRADAGYLITGGLGGVGLLAARWTIARGARHLLIIGRTLLPPRAQWRAVSADPASPVGARIAAIRELEALGATVHYAAADVGDASALQRVLTHWRDEARPPIRGIVHSAAVGDQKLLMELGRESIDRVFGVKARAAWLLHTLLPEADWLLLFSSMGSVMPSAGIGDYAAANAFVDALAHYRHSMGRLGPSVSWGQWNEVGLAATDQVREVSERFYAEQNIRGFTAVDGLRALDALLGRPAPHALVLNIERAQLATKESAEVWPLLRRLSSSPRPGAAALVRDVFVERLRGADPATAVALLRERIREHVATVLKLGDVRLDVNKPLGEYGLNSLMALELRVRLERDLVLRLPASLVFNYPTIGALAEHLLSRLGQHITPLPQATATDNAAGRVIELEGLSDAAALAALLAGNRM
jgi:acyl transferase domain-containing protein/acyl carrier protein